MWKDYLTWLLILFVVLSTSLSVEYTRAQERKELEEPSKAQKSVNEDIEKIRLSFTNLEKKIEQLEHENSEAKADLKKAEDRLEDAEAKLNLGIQALEISDFNLSAPSILIAGAGVAVALLTVLAGLALYSLRIHTIGEVERLTNRIQVFKPLLDKNIEHDRKQLNNLRAEIHWNFGLFSTGQAFTYSSQKNIESAVIYGEQGLNYLEDGKSFPKSEDVELTIAFAKANLAYYYALAGETAKRATALGYVDDGLQLFRRIGDIDLIDCFLFVYKEFATDH